MNKKFLTILLSVLLPAFLVSAVVYAATTIGNAVSVGSTLTVTGATTLNGNITLGDDINDVLTPTGYFTYLRVGTSTTFGHIGSVGADELGVEGDVEVDGAAYFDGAISAGTTLTVTGTTTLNGDVILGDTSGDRIAIPGVLNTALIWAATTTTYGIDLNAATVTNDIRLYQGETITNSPDGVVAFSGAIKIAADGASATDASTSTSPTSITCNAASLGTLTYVDDTDSAGAWLWLCELNGASSYAWILLMNQN